MQFDKRTVKRTIVYIFLGVAACIFLYWILHETEHVKKVFDRISGIFAPFVIGAGIAFVVNVPMRSIESKLTKIKNEAFRRTVALLLTILAILLVIALVFYLLIPQVITTAKNFGERLPGFFANVQTRITDFLNENPQLLQLVYENTNWQNMDFGALIEKFVDMAGNSVSTILSGAMSAIGGVLGLLVNLLIGVVFAIYSLFNKEILARQGRKLLYAYFPERFADNTVRILRLTNSTFSNFFTGQCLEVCILGSMFAVSMAIFRMPYIPLVSLLVAVTAFIPYVGAFVGCVFGAFFILVDNPVQAVGFVIMFLVLQQIENNLIYPRVVGTSIGLPGMWVLLAIAIGGQMMGLVGMLLMIPMASVAYTLLREITNKKLESSSVDAAKLEPQPPELRSHLKERRETRKKKRIDRRSNKKKK